MAKIQAIGGVFIYAKDAGELLRWYRANLGIEAAAGPSDDETWHEFFSRDPDDTDRLQRLTWAILPEGSTGARGARVNYRVTDLAAFVEMLRGKGLEVTDVDDQGYGKFAYVTDPEGNTIELFEDIEYQ